MSDSTTDDSSTISFDDIPGGHEIKLRRQALRDEFAKATLSSLIAAGLKHDSDNEKIAAACYSMADAMMKARAVRLARAPREPSA